tara:strand:+ start:1858 stop:2844 length:987 start_codon:yes stop_codon:yes gene_type:complete
MFRKPKKVLTIIKRAFVGSKWGRDLIKLSYEQISSPESVLTNLPSSSRDEEPNHFAEPIFILSAGWRSGSTLLQRMILKDPTLMIWGEPYHRSNLINSQLEQLIPLQNQWPPNNYYIDENMENLSDQWIANCWPKFSHLRNAQLMYWKTLFETPLASLGKSTWGIKEVRWGYKEVKYLKWLYPKAKFIFLCRNPYDAYASFYNYPKSAFLNWPKEPIMTAKDFSSMWLRLVKEFEQLTEDKIGILVKYEDLKNKNTQIKISKYLGQSINDASSLQRLVKPGVSKSDGTAKSSHYLPKLEKLLIRYYLRGKLKQYGYFPKINKNTQNKS